MTIPMPILVTIITFVLGLITTLGIALIHNISTVNKSITELKTILDANGLIKRVDLIEASVGKAHERIDSLEKK